MACPLTSQVPQFRGSQDVEAGQQTPMGEDHSGGGRGAQVLRVRSSLIPVSEGADTAGRPWGAASPTPTAGTPRSTPSSSRPAHCLHPGSDTPSQGLSPEPLFSLGLRPEGLTWEGN